MTAQLWLVSSLSGGDRKCQGRTDNRAAGVQAYNGGNRTTEEAYMNFLVSSPRSNLGVVKKDLLRIPAVTSARFGEQSDHGSDW